MDTQSLRTRLDDLQKQHAQLNSIAQQASSQAQAITGHINEVNHWLNTLDKVEKEKAAEKSALAEKAKRKRSKKVHTDADAAECTNLGCHESELQDSNQDESNPENDIQDDLAA